MNLNRIVRKLIHKKEVEKIKNKHSLSIEGINIGKLISYNPEVVNSFMEIWCYRVDKLIQLDKDTNNGIATKYSHILNFVRGFTFREYQALFNKHIEEKDFPFYPVFSQFRKKKGGINSEKQRVDILFDYEYDKEHYVKALRKNDLEPLLEIFFSEFVSSKMLLPSNKLLMHVFLCASTGSGKSELMRVLIHNMITTYHDASFVLIDPHGNLAESVKRLKSVANNQKEVVYIDPFLDDNKTPAFNPFQISDKSTKNITFTGEQILSSIEETLSREGGKLTEVQVNTMEKSIYFLLQRKESTLKDLVKVLRADEDIMAEAELFEPEFFSIEYRKNNNRTRKALLDRVEKLLNSPTLKNLLGGTSTFDLEDILNNGKILIINLGEASEMSQIAFGKILFSSIKSIIRKRKKNNFPCQTFLFIDEIEVVNSGSLDYVLNQLRGFGLSCILATQYISQLQEQAVTVKQNTAIKIVASDDHDEIKKVIKVPKEVQLKDYEFFLKVRGRPVEIFKSLDFLLRNKDMFEISLQEEREFDKLQLERYYRPIDQNTPIVEKPFIKTEITIEKEVTKPNSFKAPFELQINEEEE